MKSEKGISLAITAVVVIAVGLTVLLVVLGYFVGGFGRTGTAIHDVTVEAEEKGAGEIGAVVGGVGEIWKSGKGGRCNVNENCEEGLVCAANKSCWPAGA